MASRVEVDASCARFAEEDRRILICLLGTFRLLQGGRSIALRGDGRSAAVLSHLALRQPCGVPRDDLLNTLWPESDPALSAQSLHSLVYGLNRTLSGYLGGALPIVRGDGCYRLNSAAGVGVDVADFDALADEGDRRRRTGDGGGTAALYGRAARLYRGDLCIGGDLHTVVERERLRARHLTLLAYIADHLFVTGNYTGCLLHALDLLGHDPCREDAHRLLMRAYVRLGERAQALRQYRLCERTLREEFDAPPEPETTELFDQVRLKPQDV
jgi:DNA-binding SARP family transcriptional activator